MNSLYHFCSETHAQNLGMLLIGAGLKNKGSLIGENDAILIRGRVSAAFLSLSSC